MPLTPESRSKLVSTSAADWRNAASCVGRDAFDLELGRAELAAMLVDRMLRRPQRFAQPLHLRLGLDPQRIVGLDAQHQVHAALEIEPELQRLSISQLGAVMPKLAATIG